MVTTDAKPEETVYLRGFIGVDYDAQAGRQGMPLPSTVPQQTGKPTATGGLPLRTCRFCARHTAAHSRSK